MRNRVSDYLFFRIIMFEISREYIISESDLRNESNIFSIDGDINQKRMDSCINSHSALLQKFSVIFSVDTLINQKYLIYSLSFNFHWISRRQIFSFIKFQIFKAEIMHMMLQSIFITCLNNLIFSTNQNKSDEN